MKDPFKTMPSHLTLRDGAMTPGGSASLRALAEPGGDVIVFTLDRQGLAPDSYPPQFFVNGVTVPVGSAEEAHWLRLIQEAALPVATSGAEGAVQQGLTLVPPGVGEYFHAAGRGAGEDALGVLARYLVSFVVSDTYRSDQPAVIPPTTRERIVTLLAQDRRVEAMRVYRNASPGVTLKEAKDAIEAIAAIASADTEIVLPVGEDLYSTEEIVLFLTSEGQELSDYRLVELPNVAMTFVYEQEGTTYTSLIEDETLDRQCKEFLRSIDAPVERFR